MLNNSEYEALKRDAEAVDRIYKLRNTIAGNSATMRRSIAAREFDDAGQQLAQEIAKKGWRNTAIDQSINWLMHRFDGLNDKLAGEVSAILYETDPKKKYQIVKSLIQQGNAGNVEAATKVQAFYGALDDVANAAKQRGDALTAAGLRGIDKEIGHNAIPDRTNNRDNSIGNNGIIDSTGRKIDSLSDDELMNLYQNMKDATPAPQSMIQQNEGFRSGVYTDTTGNPTVGYGLNLKSGIAGKVWKQAGLPPQLLRDVRRGIAQISHEQGMALYRAAEGIAINDAKIYYGDGFDGLTKPQKAALVDMSYQMGADRLGKFHTLRKHLKNKDANGIINTIRRSQYFKQTPERARRTAELLIQFNGVNQFSKTGDQNGL